MHFIFLLSFSLTLCMPFITRHSFLSSVTYFLFVFLSQWISRISLGVSGWILALIDRCATGCFLSLLTGYCIVASLYGAYLQEGGVIASEIQESEIAFFAWCAKGKGESTLPLSINLPQVCFYCCMKLFCIKKKSTDGENPGVFWF